MGASPVLHEGYSWGMGRCIRCMPQGYTDPTEGLPPNRLAIFIWRTCYEQPSHYPRCCKRYGDFTALNGVSLDIREGEFFTLLGPSGCGKTTLLRMIAGFNSIEGGDFYFGDKRINDVPAHKRDIGMVFQNYAIFRISAYGTM